VRTFARLFVLSLILTLGLALVPAVAPSAAPAARVAEAATNSVDIKGFAFSPQVLTVKVGDTVTWTNSDSVQHTVTSTTPAGVFDSGTLATGKTYSFTFTKAGKFDYQCAIHPTMTGTIMVTDTGQAPAAMTGAPAAQPVQMDMTSTVTTTTGTAAEPNQETIQNLAFDPQVLTVTVGMTVTWTNRDPMGHTATSTNTAEPFGSGTLLTGQSYSYAFTKVGSYDYICEIHPSMKGTIVVVAGGAASAASANPTPAPTGGSKSY
jgi:plastocyanin